MSGHRWILNIGELQPITNGWGNLEAAALCAWALEAGDSLHYLLDLDEDTFGGEKFELRGHPQDAVNTGHVRWAAGTAVTVVDLSAATLAHLYNYPPRRNGNEYSLRNFADVRNRGLMSTKAQDWVEGVHKDSDYEVALGVRNPLTHSLLNQTKYGMVGRGRHPAQHHGRSAFHVGLGGQSVDARPLIELCVDLATRHLDSFLDSISRKEIP